MTQLRALLRLARSQALRFTGAVAMGAASHVLTIAIASLSALMIGSVGAGEFDNLDQLATWLMVLLLPAALAPWLESILSHIAAYRILMQIRSRVHGAFRKLGPAFYVEQRSGDLATRVVGDIELTERFYAHTLANALVAVIVPVSALVVLTTLHWALAAVLFPILVALIVVPALFRRGGTSEGAAVRRHTGSLSSDIVDAVQGLREVVVYGATRQILDNFADLGRQIDIWTMRKTRRTTKQRLAVDSLIVICVIAVLLVGSSLVLSGVLDPELLPVAVVLASFAFVSLGNLTEVVAELNLVAAGVNRVWEVLETPPRVLDLGNEILPLQPNGIGVSLEGVTFRYVADDVATLDNVSLSIEPGETVALVGPSGAGKSTLLGLLQRHWDPDVGRVTLGNRDIRHVPIEALRNWITVVPQDVYLFNRSLRDNLTLGSDESNLSRLSDVAAATGVAQIAAVLPDGFDTYLGERGTQLSGGQRQRVAFARALLRNSPVLLLDEPVSNLDAENERALLSVLEEESQGRSVLIVAHRLSTILAADRIIFLDQGRVVASGTHPELMTTTQSYNVLVKAQHQTQ